jgi:hypothetical protein
MSKQLIMTGLCGVALLFAGLYAVNSHADVPTVTTPATRSVLYLTYPTEGERRCAGKERVGYRANAECCPAGFSLAGIRMNGEVADAVCVQD